jgi:hypothetical protein
MSLLRVLICAATLAFAASPTLAAKFPFPGRPVTLGAPGPVAGVGLPALAVAGGYIAFAWRKRRGKAKKNAE